MSVRKGVIEKKVNREIIDLLTEDEQMIKMSKKVEERIKASVEMRKEVERNNMEVKFRRAKRARLDLENFC